MSTKGQFRIGDIVEWVKRPALVEAAAATYPDLWHILVVHEKTERVVARSAVLAGLDAWYPERAYWHAKGKWQKQPKRMLDPLFPGYVFARAPAGTWLPDVTRELCEVVEANRHGEVVTVSTGIPMAIGELRMDGWLLGIRTSVIEALRRRQEAGEFDTTQGRYTTGNPAGFEVGEKAVIKTDPFSGFICDITEIDEVKGTAGVEIYIFGRATQTTLPLDDLKRMA